MMTKRWSGWLLTAAVVATVSSACANRLKHYTQVTLQAAMAEDGRSEDAPGVAGASAVDDADANLALLTQTKAVLAQRLTGLGIELAEITTQAPDKIVVRLPQTVDAETVVPMLTRIGRLYVRNQKPDTEADLANGIETLHRLLVQQTTLVQVGKPAEAAALQADIDQGRQVLFDLFEASALTSSQLAMAIAHRSLGERDIWEIAVQFDEQGADMFAEQTKAIAGTDRTVGWFLDDVLLSTPVVDAAYAETGVRGGKAVIPGHFTATAAKDLAIQLNSGALPVALEVVERSSTADPAVEKDLTGPADGGESKRTDETKS